MKVPTLKGKKVILRPLSLKDAPNFCKWLADPEVTQFLSVFDTTPPTLKAEREFLLEQKSKNDVVQFSIDTIKGKHVGTISLMKIDTKHKHAEYGIFIGDKEYWHQGIGTESGKIILNYGFRKLRLHKVYLRYVDFNVAGAKSYKKLGFKKDGIQRQHIYRKKYFHDEIIMSILKNEFISRNIKYKT